MTEEKTDFQKIIAIMKVMAMSAAEENQYKSWPDDFFRKHPNEDIERLLFSVGRVNLTTLTEAECEILGLSYWDRDEPEPMRMVPLFLYPFLAHGQTLRCIDGSHVVVGPNYDVRPSGEELQRTMTETGFSRKVEPYEYIDNDHRGGYIAYGFVPVKDAVTCTD